ncbi:MAG: hypothetical protein WBC80_09995, partial [Isosphaeraceae bacterium]
MGGLRGGIGIEDNLPQRPSAIVIGVGHQERRRQQHPTLHRLEAELNPLAIAPSTALARAENAPILTTARDLRSSWSFRKSSRS